MSIKINSTRIASNDVIRALLTQAMRFSVLPTVMAAILISSSSIEAQDMPSGADNFYKSDKVTAQKVTFKNQYQMAIVGNLFVPKSANPGAKNPAIIVGQELAHMKAQKKEQDAFQKEQARQLANYRTSLNAELGAVNRYETVSAEKSHDVFISHASEDKEPFVRSLAEALTAAGINVWYDETALTVGDSLRRSIDKGLASSRYGIVVLSSSFFAKGWTQYELDGLVTRETSGGKKVILPIWHKVSKDEVASYSPTLADKVALNTGIQSLEEIVDQLVSVIQPAADSKVSAEAKSDE